MQKTLRLDKLLSHMGLGTRSEIRGLVNQGRVSVNGVKVKDSGMQVRSDTDVVEVDRVRVTYRQFIYLMMNKPQGLVSATEDNWDRTVVDLLSSDYAHYAPFPVGRLDKDTEGLLLLTNDGNWAHNLLSPRKHVPKTYYAVIDGLVDLHDEQAFRAGVVLEDGYCTQPAVLTIKAVDTHEEGYRSIIELTIHEGKFHQVKRMFQAVGKRVVFLKRLSMGALLLDPALEPGQYRELGDEEVALLREPRSSAFLVEKE